MSSSQTRLQLLALPFEIIHKILSSLSPIELAICQLVNKHLNTIISESLVLQYAIALALAKADDNPCSVVPLPQKLEDLRSSEAAWASLQPKFIASLPVKQRPYGIYDLSAGTYLLGNMESTALQYLQLPTRVGDPLDWRRIAVDKAIIDMGFCVFEHDLIAVITSTPSTLQTGLLDIEMTLLEYSTGRPHPRAKNSTIFITSALGRPALMCEIVGQNLVLILNFIHGVHAEDRIFIWNWSMNVLKTVFMTPYHTYSGVLFLEEDLIILPNAKSAAFDFFRIPIEPTADTLKPILSLQLPSLADGMEIYRISCRAEPNPIPDISRLNKRQRDQERADVGMDEMDPFAPKRGFLASAEDSICIFRIQFTNPVFVLGGTGVGSHTLFVHRSSFLRMARQCKVTPDASHCPEGYTDAGVTLRWADWGPPVSRWFNANATSQWITTSAGQRCVMIHDDAGAYSPITVLDFNPFNIRKLKAKFEREKETAKGKLHQELRSTAGEMAMADPANDEERGVFASEIGGLLSSSARPQTATAINQGMHMEDESEQAGVLGVGEMDVGDDDDDDDDGTMDDDSDIHISGVDSDNAMPDLDSVYNSDEECPSEGYTTNPHDHRHPGRAVCRLFEAPSRGSPGAFAEEVEGRLPYIEYVSEREYDYGGVLLDEERVLGITTDVMGRTCAIDIFYFG